MQRQKVILSERPIVLKLDAEPSERSSNYGSGVEYMYVVNDDAGVLWAKPDLHAAILRSGAQPGDEIQIQRRKFQNGGFSYEVRLVGDAAEIAQPAPPQQPAPAPQQQYRDRLVQQQQQRGPQEVRRIAPGQPAAQPAQEGPDWIFPAMDRCVAAGVTVTQHLFEQLAKLGLPVPTDENVAAEISAKTGITLFLTHKDSRRGR